MKKLILNKKIYLFLAVVGFAAIVPTVAEAEEVVTVEFTSFLYSESTGVVNQPTASQRFRTLNDHISGVDIWLENEGSGGNATIELRRVSDNGLLASKTVYIPTTAGDWGGDRFHIEFNSQSPTVSTNTYKINIISSLQSLRLYHAPLAEVQEHDSTYSVGEHVLPAYFGETEQDFALKFALYEDEENSDPEIENLNVDVTSENEVNFTFHANEPVDSRVLFAPSGSPPSSGSSFNEYFTQCNVGFDPCAVKISAQPGTKYDYRLIARDEWGNESVLEGTFTTSGESEEETSDLEIINPKVVPITSRHVKMVWTTNIPANSNIVVSVLTGSTYQAILNAWGNVYELEHSIQTGAILTPNTQYKVKISSADLEGFSEEVELFFTTDAEESIPQEEPPQEEEPPAEEEPSEETPTSTEEEPDVTEDEGEEEIITNSDGDSTIIEWSSTGGIPTSGYRVDIFDGNNNYKFTVTSDTNQVKLDGLESGDYKAIVYEDNLGIYDRVGEPEDFTVHGTGAPTSSKRTIYILISTAVLVAALVAVLLKVRKRQLLTDKKASGNEGLTLLEVIISVAILVSGIAIIGLFARDVSNIGVDYTQRFSTEQEVRLTINSLVPELRSAMQSNEGSYPIAEASGSTLIFYSDLEGDGLVEEIRYFIDGGDLKKGVITPQEHPVKYLSSDEKIRTVVHNIVTSTIFAYYDKDFTGTEDPLSFPVTVSDIRMIEINISAQDTGQISPATFSVRVTPRNLRTSL